MTAAVSPMRYPGGKASLYSDFRKTIRANFGRLCIFVEPFAGGAGLGLSLLSAGDINTLYLNDIDRSIFCIWENILYNPDKLCGFVDKVPLTIDTWKEARHIFTNADDYSDTDLGFASFYLNRTNVSGILSGGPMGGKAQKDYSLGCRFNRKDLIERIQHVSEMRDRIVLSNVSAIDMIPAIENDRNKSKVLLYLDPPYYQKGKTLYRYAFTDKDHAELKKNLDILSCKWILSYDRHDFIYDLYRDSIKINIGMDYSAYDHIRTREYLFSNFYLPI